MRSELLQVTCLLVILLDLSIHIVYTFYIRDASFVLKHPACQTDIAIYRIVTVTSKIHCSTKCLDNNIGFCDKFVWDDVNKKCMLYSENMNSTVTVSIQTDWKLYRRISREVCNCTGYEYYSTVNMCYKFYKNKASWVNAQVRCQEDGGNLVSITNNETRDIIYDVSNCNKRTWIGLRYETWLNGQPFVHLFGPSTKLDNHDSEVPGDSDNTCGSLVPKTTEKWVIDNSCYIRERPFFICEMRV